jgi:uncharacterized protein (TIGR02594 family)
MNTWQTKSNLNVRSGPGTDYEILDTLSLGDRINEVATDGWCLIPMEDGSFGWVSRQFLIPAPAPAPVPITPIPAPPSSTQTPMAQAVNYFVSQGWSPVQAAAIVGNLMQESNLKPTAVNPSSGAYGIAQWLGSRLVQLQGSDNWPTLQGQLGFVNNELKTSEKAAGDALRATTTLADATMIVRTKYERCGESEANDANRLLQATMAYNLVMTAPAPVTPAGEPVQVRWARTKLGYKEGVNDVEIESWYKLTGLPQSEWNDKTVPWCGVFVSAAYALNGIKAVDSAAALDWLKSGTPVDTPRLGDNVIFDWTLIGKTGHHVAIVLALQGNLVQVIGGNQSNSVSITTYPVAAVKGYRRLA